MPPKRTYNYEAMFLASQGAAADFKGLIDHINEILSRGHAEVIAMKKWDERRLAYEIKGQKRGIYILTYFKAPNDMLSHIERDCNLSEKIIRTLITRVDHLTVEEMSGADGRQDLEIEAKLRAEQAARQPDAPVAAAPAPVEVPAPEPAPAEA